MWPKYGQQPRPGPHTVEVVGRDAHALCLSTAYPRRDAWDPTTLDAVCDGLPDRHRALVPVGAGLGLRQGEAFGLGVDLIDFLRREVEVRRQVKWLSGRGLVFAPPKRGKTRTVPLPEVVALALAEHIRRFPPVEVTLPWTGKGAVR